MAYVILFATGLALFAVGFALGAVCCHVGILHQQNSALSGQVEQARKKQALTQVLKRYVARAESSRPERKHDA